MKLIISVLIIIIIIISYYLFKTKFIKTNNIINGKKSKKCADYLDINWKNFESRHGHLSDQNIRSQLFPLLKEFFPTLSKNQCIYDVGGNVGDITYMLHQYYPDTLIYTIEPLLKNYEELKRKFNTSNYIKLHNIALGSFNGKKKSHTYLDGKLSDYLYPGRILAEFDINYMTTDTFYKKNCIILIYNI